METRTHRSRGKIESGDTGGDLPGPAPSSKKKGRNRFCSCQATCPPLRPNEGNHPSQHRLRMARADVRSLRRLPAVAVDETAKPGCSGAREDDVSLGKIIREAEAGVKLRRVESIGTSATMGRQARATVARGEHPIPRVARRRAHVDLASPTPSRMSPVWVECISPNAAVCARRRAARCRWKGGTMRRQSALTTPRSAPRPRPRPRRGPPPAPGLSLCARSS